MKIIYSKCNYMLSIATFTIFIVLIGCSTTSQGNHNTNAVVTNVVDGDTVDIQLDNKEERVRLLLVDTPETKHPTKPVQPYGKEASQFTKEMLEGKQVKVELDVSERDKYGRLLAYIWIDGKMFNELLLEKGLARVAYVYPPNTKYVDSYYKAQKQAQTAGLGIWSIENYATEAGFNDAQPNINLEADDDCTIKGNINSKGEKIYHTLNSPSYEQTKPEVIFCTEEEAVAAGFRTPRK